MATEPGLASRTRRGARRFLAWTRKHVPPGMRLVLGVLLMLGGVLGFLPVLGFWMFPLGLAVAALDIRPIWRRLHQKRKR